MKFYRNKIVIETETDRQYAKLMPRFSPEQIKEARSVWASLPINYFPQKGWHIAILMLSFAEQNNGPLAQSAEQRTHNSQDAGSTPARPTKIKNKRK